MSCSMKISGYTFIRNAEKLYIPLKESIASILPLVDEYVIALNPGDEGDHTEEWIHSLNSPKIKCIPSSWQVDVYKDGTEYARQSDLAKQHCTGDWLFYLQADEVVHEQDLPLIRQACEDNLSRSEVEGFLFQYLHFWGDYQHYHRNHKWYPREIRIIRNLDSIHSWRDAQSFRHYQNFQLSPNIYLQKEHTSKLQVKELPARIFHYGWVRPPHMMNNKVKAHKKNYQGTQENVDEQRLNYFDYGPMDRLTSFTGSHPNVMQDWMAKHDWSDKLQPSGPLNPHRELYAHERWRNRALSFIENNFLGGRSLGGFKNYKLIK